MAYYDGFMACNHARPKQYWQEQLQEMVNQEFDNASTVQYDIEEEIAFGTLEFKTLSECRITTLVDAKTGQRVNDDYKRIIFKDLTKIPELGTRYRFDNNIWMVFSTDNIKTDTSSAYLRRCNNVLTMEDKYGNIHQEPCYIDYKITESQLFKEWTLDVPQGRIYVTCQLNQHTQDVDINKRYIFNDNVYKIRECSKFDRQQTFSKNSVPVISFYADVDERNSADRFDIEVADYFEPAYKVHTPEEITCEIGTQGKMIKSVTFVDDEIFDEPVLYESSNIDVCKINQYNGKYQCVGIGECMITCTLYHNPAILSKTKIKVVDKKEDVITDTVLPDIHYIKLNQTLTYSIYHYINGEKTNTKFNIKAYNVPESCFTINSTDNEFTIKYNRLCTDGLLKIVCENLDNGEKTDFYIELGGVW